MKERPSWPMKAWEVQALLAGRKTQTRRLVKPQPAPCDHAYYKALGAEWGDRPTEFYELAPRQWACRYCGNGTLPSLTGAEAIPCPYGVVGDRLWVREKWQPDPPRDGSWDDNAVFGDQRYSDLSAIPTKYKNAQHCLYAASWDGQELTWRSPIFMPRWASCITLEITGIRVERVQAISEADAKAEGMDDDGCELAFRQAIGKKKIKEEYARWLLLEDRSELPNGGHYCIDCAAREVNKHNGAEVDGWNEHFSSDGVPYCESCNVALCHSLTSYGIESELDHHEEHGPPSGYDAYVLAEVCSGMGDYLDEHKGRMAKVAYAALWNTINGPGSWDANPWVWAIEFRRVDA